MAFMKQKWKIKKNSDTQTVYLDEMKEPLGADCVTIIAQIQQILVTDDLEITQFERYGAGMLSLNTLIDGERLQQDVVPRIRLWLDKPPQDWENLVPASHSCLLTC